MTAYNLEIDGKFYGLFHTPEQAKDAAESHADQSLEWSHSGFLTAYFDQDNGYSSSLATVRITIADGIENEAYHVSVRAANQWKSTSLEEVTRIFGLSDGTKSGFLTDWVFLPKVNKWFALYLDQALGPEIATAEKVFVQGIPEEV